LTQLTPQEAAVVGTARVAHMATADSSAAPHLIPICFVYDGGFFYSVLDRKPKRASLTGLKRVRNIISNPQVALVVDHYEEDWGRLWYVLVSGAAELIDQGEEHQRAIALLRDKYEQYRDMDIASNPVIKITASRFTSWGQFSVDRSLPRRHRGHRNKTDRPKGSHWKKRKYTNGRSRK
jgi:PPOX class probable F420-dependent enzyme